MSSAFTNKYLPIVLILGMLQACLSSSTYVPESNINPEKKPDWVMRGSAPVVLKNKRHFLGVASVEEQGLYSSSARVADRQARHEVHQLVTGYLEVASRSYIAQLSGSTHVYDGSALRRQINSSLRGITEQAEIVGHWRDAHTGMIHSLSVLDFEQVHASIRHNHNIDSGFRVFFDHKATVLFDDSALSL